VIIGVLRRRNDFRSAKNCQCVAHGRESHHRYSNRVCCFSNADQKASVVTRDAILTRFLAKRSDPTKSSENVPVWAILGPYSKMAGFRLQPGRQHPVQTLCAGAPHLTDKTEGDTKAEIADAHRRNSSCSGSGSAFTRGAVAITAAAPDAGGIRIRMRVWWIENLTAG